MHIKYALDGYREHFKKHQIQEPAMELKHTAGPWAEDEKHTGGAKAIIGDGNQLVALVYGKTTEERDANARAICSVATLALPKSEWHEDFGPVVWWRFPLEEMPWIGSPGDSDWYDHYTHWTALPPLPVQALI